MSWFLHDPNRKVHYGFTECYPPGFRWPYGFVSQGAWECPRCRKVNAPDVKQCPCGPQPSASDATGKTPAWRETNGGAP